MQQAEHLAWNQSKALDLVSDIYIVRILLTRELLSDTILGLQKDTIHKFYASQGSVDIGRTQTRIHSRSYSHKLGNIQHSRHTLRSMMYHIQCNISLSLHILRKTECSSCGIYCQLPHILHTILSHIDYNSRR